jgi:hypothetical protein
MAVAPVRIGEPHRKHGCRRFAREARDLAALALLAVTAVGTATLHQRMIDDRVEKLDAVVQSSLGIARGL